MKRMTTVAALGAIAAAIGVIKITSLPAVDDNLSDTSRGQQPAPANIAQSADGPRGALPSEREARGQWRTEYNDRLPEPGYTEWGSSPGSEWGEPEYGGWSPEPPGREWGSESSLGGEESAQRQWGTPRTPQSALPSHESGSERPAAPTAGQSTFDPWATTDDQGPSAQSRGRAAEPPPPAPATEAAPASEQPVATPNYPAQPVAPSVAAPPPVYGGYPGYAPGAPPPPPPGWGYGYPGYAGPPGPYGGPGGPRGGDSGWPWGDMMPWGNRGGGSSPWSSWMPWSK